MRLKDGTPCAMKIARTVWSRGKGGDYIKTLPIAMNKVSTARKIAS